MSETSFVGAAVCGRFAGQQQAAGKRGGVRVIYYWAVDREIILMLLIYGKNEQDDLTAEQLRVLKGLVEEEFK